MSALPRCVLAACLASLLCQGAVGRRSAKSVAGDLLEISDTADIEGINDYPRALEFQKSWVDSENYEDVLEGVRINVDEMLSQSTTPPIQESMKLVRDLWMLTDQALANQNSYQCFNLCVLCEPSPQELVEDRLRTIAVSRAKDYKDKLKIALIAPADAAGGLVAGVFAGLLAAGAFGTAGGIVADSATAEKIGPGFVSLMVGLVSGAVTGAVVLPFAVAVLPLLGAASGAGITGALTNCARVGFETAEDGKFLHDQPFANHFGANSYGLKSLRNAMEYNVSKYVDGFFHSNPDDLYKPDESSSEEVQNYKALSHCEYLRLRPFDIRHAILCARHSRLCGKRGGMLVAEAKDGQCAALSGQDVFLSRLFQESTQEDKEAEATEELVVEASVPPTTTTTTTTSTITTTRAQPPAISLKEAAQRGDVAALAQHLQAGSDLNAVVDPDYDGWTAAHFAAAGAKLCATDDEGKLLTELAARNRNAAETLKVLAKAGCDMNAKVARGGTVAHWAADNPNWINHGDGAAALKFLHEAGANLDAKDNAGATPACWAAERGNAEALEALAEARADLNDASNKFGFTPAHVAAEMCKVEALRVLIKAGVNLNVIDNYGYTVADRAADTTRLGSETDLIAKKEEALKLILKAGGKRKKV
ncbi:ANKK1 [Symbiodinium sp. KB8]|nr:ANKK1 [Symbiodinium sp. KB8]